MGQMIRATVVGPNEIAGVPTGGTVELDPERVNVVALVLGGHIELSTTAERALDKADGG